MARQETSGMRRKDHSPGNSYIFHIPEKVSIGQKHAGMLGS